MKVLIVSSGNSRAISSFVAEQANEIGKLNIIIHHYLIRGKGILGYLMNFGRLKKIILEFGPDIIHAHYGFSGLLANLQRKVPVITTYHGSDINNAFPLLFSKLSILLSAYNIFTSQKLALKANVKNKYSIISCGVDMCIFNEITKTEAQNSMKLPGESFYVLFPAGFENKNKNYKLAKSSIDILANQNINIKLIELKGYKRQEVNILLNAVDCVLVTSKKESGPLVIKEAMAVNKTAVSVDVGDVKEMFDNLEGYYLSSYSASDLSEKIKKSLSFSCKTKGRDRILNLGLDSKSVALRIRRIYHQILVSSNR